MKRFIKILLASFITLTLTLSISMPKDYNTLIAEAKKSTKKKTSKKSSKKKSKKSSSKKGSYRYIKVKKRVRVKKRVKVKGKWKTKYVYVTKTVTRKVKATTTSVAKAQPANRNISIPSGEKVIYLTFDDGPSKNTRSIVDTMDRYGVHATFFVTGNNAGYRSNIKYAYDHGNAIAAHSYTHNYNIYRSLDTYFNDLNQVRNMIKDITGSETNLVRLPGGSSNHVSRKYAKGIMTSITNELNNRGYRYFDWNVSSGDAEGTTMPTSTIINSSKSGLSQVVLLMHDASTKTTTAQALGSIIEWYKNRGYTFKTLNETNITCHHSIWN